MTGTKRIAAGSGRAVLLCGACGLLGCASGEIGEITFLPEPARDAAAPAGGDSDAAAVSQDATASDASAPPPGDAGQGNALDTGSGPPIDASSDGSLPIGDDAGPPPVVSLPFYVSDAFSPSGLMNDPNGITVSTGANGTASCPTRAPDAGGACYVNTWTSTGPPWAGVYWLYPASNWGNAPGVRVPAGATQVSFYARGAAGGEVLYFKVGGVNDPVAPSVGPHGDSFYVSSTPVTLTTSWTRYTLSLQGVSYAPSVLGGFVWVTSGSQSSVAFYLDDIQWE